MHISDARSSTLTTIPLERKNYFAPLSDFLHLSDISIFRCVQGTSILLHVGLLGVDLVVRVLEDEKTLPDSLLRDSVVLCIPIASPHYSVLTRAILLWDLNFITLIVLAMAFAPCPHCHGGEAIQRPFGGLGKPEQKPPTNMLIWHSHIFCSCIVARRRVKKNE